MVTQLEPDRAASLVRPRRAPQGARRGRRPLGQGDRRWAVWVVPSLVLLTVFFLVPFLLNLPFAFSSWSGYSEIIEFVGLSNFEVLWVRGILGNAVVLTIAYALISMVIQNTVSLGLALSLQDTTFANSIFRSVLFLPVLISPLAAGYIWRAIVSQDGPLNATISQFVPGFDYVWLGDPVSALVIVAFVEAWKWSGLATLVYIAGLNSIPRSLLEAAAIDGANRLQRFWRVSFPLLAPAFTFNVVTTLIGALNAYDVIASTTAGGPGNGTVTLNVAVQQQFGLGYFGSASSLSLLVTVLVVTLAVPLVLWLRRREVVA